MRGPPIVARRKPKRKSRTPSPRNPRDRTVEPLLSTNAPHFSPTVSDNQTYEGSHPPEEAKAETKGKRSGVGREAESERDNQRATLDHREYLGPRTNAGRDLAKNRGQADFWEPSKERFHDGTCAEHDEDEEAGTADEAGPPRE
eukprot:CAMPEP_0197449680 /NCGR_PEP_ID=MMETSP1175-20131217/22486_1 /TAXON_ID=1003142 /ORGANISM="Triceratium dubium, Strain CCMP147" /LENGTH=143 /DNA_ID=CAMNT_0042981883 /DNA_START=122 /DNA_END=554 /DNA_ORIENTATION=+